MKEEFEITNYLLATHGQRLANYLIDFVVQYIIIFILATALALIALAFENNAIVDLIDNSSTITDYLIGAVI